MDYVRGASLSAWAVSLLLPYWWIANWQSMEERASEGHDFRNYYYAGFAVCFIAHLTLGMGPWFAAPFRVLSSLSGRFLTAFCLVVLMVSPLSLVPKATAVYAIATWGVYLLLYLYWDGDHRVKQRTTVLAGCAVFAWLFILMAKLGVSVGYAVGGINRNSTGIAAVGAMICCQISPNKKIQWTAIVVAIFMALIVSSRGSLVALFAFFTAYYGAYKGTFRGATHAMIALCAFGALVLVWPHLYHVVFEDILHLHDKSRGLSGGFTGRVDLWKQAAGAFWKKPIFGYGFRASTHGHGSDIGGIHSGYLKIFVETGFVGGFLILTTVFSETLRRYRLVQRFRHMPPADAPALNVPETMRLNAIVFATLFMTLTIWVYEQQYINLGSIASLVFWLMMAAPVYVSAQGQSLRD